MIRIDDWGVRRELSAGEREEVSWEDLTEVSIVTTDDGPFVEDVFYRLAGRQGGCLVPQGDRNARRCWNGSSGFRASTTIR
ncbi:MAG TPA: hypothetical protein VE981_04285 [Planctomycetota bacterium]|nr:hypothetical protein [Planctomycetota bacterium]